MYKLSCFFRIVIIALSLFFGNGLFAQPILSLPERISGWFAPVDLVQPEDGPGRMDIVVVGDTVPATMTSFAGNYSNKRVELHWEIRSEANVLEYEVEYSTNGTAFSTVGSVTAVNAHAYAFSHPVTGNDDYYYRLKIVDQDARFEYSKLLYIKNPAAGNSGKVFVVPTVINNRMMNVHLDKQYNVLQLISLEGKEVWKENITGRSGIIRLPIPALRQGHYIVRLVADSGIRTQRIIIGN